MPRSSAVKWTREHLLIALNLYHKLPFGKYDQSNKVVIDIAKRMGRTPSSLAMKLSNFASLDPVHQARGVKGLSGAAKQDRLMWGEFRSDTENLKIESEQLIHDLYTSDDTEELDFLQKNTVRLERTHLLIGPTGKTEAIATVKVRRGQQFFRQTVLNAYGIRCCITGINVPRLLVASHIKPWSDFPDQRLQPQNGLCLSSLHDAAFDSGLITLDEKLRLVLSKQLKEYFPHVALEQSFVSYEGQAIRLPNKIAEPNPEYLHYHRESVFRDV